MRRPLSFILALLFAVPAAPRLCDVRAEPARGRVRLNVMLKAGFADGWTRGGDVTAGLTYPADKPAKRIDYIFYRGLGEDLHAATSVPDTLASDHRPLVVQLRL